MILLLSLFLLITPAQAVEPGEMLTDPALEARAGTIGKGLRCMVCQNETVEASDASFAHDVRLLIRERLSSGQSDAEIVAYLRSRYGDYILMQPPFEKRTLALWLSPALILLGSALALALLHRQRRFADDDDDDDDDDEGEGEE